MTEKSQKMVAAPTVPQRALRAAVGTVALGVTAMYADIDISFSSRLDAVNEQSDGTPMDTSFTFQLGSFDGLTPDASNTHLWKSHWVEAPNSNSDPLSGASASYTQAPLQSFLAPNTGESNQFSGAITLYTNNSPFSQTDQAYIWGYDDRGESGTGEWVLITNSNWMFPEVVDGLQLDGVELQVTDAGTFAVLGSVNSAFATVGDDPHLETASVTLLPVPEPSVAMLLLGGLGLAMVRRR
jgi:hypothetical protein